MQMKTYSFSVGYEEILIENFINRYHFNEKDIELIRSTGLFLAEVVKITAVIYAQTEKAVCAVTLGKRYDELESIVAASENLLLHYCLECYGMEFLSVAYGKINEQFFQETGKWMGKYHFWNDAESEMTKIFTDELEGKGIFWEKGMLRPLKTVIFTAEYRNSKTENSSHNCAECENFDCNFREIIEKGKEWNASQYFLSGSPLCRNMVQKEKQADKSRQYSYGISRILERGGKDINR